MFNRGRLKLTPLHLAVIEGNAKLVAQLKDSPWRFQLESNGFNPLELAQLLGQRQCQKLLTPIHSTLVKVQFKDQPTFSLIKIKEFEQIFKIIYRPFLTFSSYQCLEELIRLCPYLLRFEDLIFSNSEHEAFYQTQLSAGAIADVFIKWINPLVGYGLFAATPLPKNLFVGEYTGRIRRIDKSCPHLNGYCFHYPTRFWSLKYFVIDSLHEGNLLRFVNHSHQSNLQPLWLVNRGILHLILITKCSIDKGMELTFDYGPDYWIRREKNH